jgi:hypothetical protein
LALHPFWAVGQCDSRQQKGLGGPEKRTNPNPVAGQKTGFKKKRNL